MRIHVVNPNTTASMTEKIGAAARAAASPGVEIVATNPAYGPESIEGYYDEVFSIPGLIEEIRAGVGADAVVIACFDDTGLDAARCATDVPVIGIGEAAFHVASLIAERFSVVTTLARSIAPIQHNLTRYGLASRCARVRASEVSVLALEDPASNACAAIREEIETALREDGAEAIVLGCAGMTDLARSLSEAVGAPVLDGVACAVGLAESLVRLGLRTSKRNTYAAPIAKRYAGAFARFAP
jgi:allantoin racemase